MDLKAKEHQARSLTKAVSWRLLGSLDTLVLSYVITRNMTVAGSIAAVETVTKVVLYYAHERLWSMVSWGQRPHPLGHSLYVRRGDLAACFRSGVATIRERLLFHSGTIGAAAALLLCFWVVLSPKPLPPDIPQRIVAARPPEALSTMVAEREPTPPQAPPPAPDMEPAANPIQLAATLDVSVASTDATGDEQLRAEAAGEGEHPKEPPQQPMPEATAPVASVEATPPTFVGTWAANASACASRPTRLLLAVINNAGARAGETFCAFKKKAQDGAGWNVIATCSNPRERWTANVRLAVEGDRLRWSSQRGSQSYVRCGQKVLMAGT
jgi:uncharacterized membrane protein